MKCFQSFKTTKAFHTHMSENHGTEFAPHRCKFCKFGAKNLKILKLHVKCQHPEEIQFNCDICDTNFYTESHKNNHMQREHQDSQTFCKICQKFVSQKYLWHHIQSVHGAKTRTFYGCEMINDTNADVYKCAK